MEDEEIDIDEFLPPDLEGAETLKELWVCERGSREGSLDQTLYRIALDEGVEFQFNKPSGLSFDIEGRLWLVDSKNSRLILFKPEFQ